MDIMAVTNGIGRVLAGLVTSTLLVLLALAVSGVVGVGGAFIGLIIPILTSGGDGSHLWLVLGTEGRQGLVQGDGGDVDLLS